MPFFANAKDVTISNSSFQEIHGDLTVHNGNRYNIDSFNKTDTRTTGSYNDSSKKWRGTVEDKKGHTRRGPSPGGSSDSLTDAQENNVRTASAPRPTSGIPASSQGTNTSQGDITTPPHRRRYPFLPDEDERHLREITETAKKLRGKKPDISPPAGRAPPSRVTLTDTSEEDSDEEESDEGGQSQSGSLGPTTTSVIPPTPTPLLHSVSSTPFSSGLPVPAPLPHSASYTPSHSSAPPETTSSPLETTASSTSVHNGPSPSTPPVKSKTPLGRVKRLFRKKPPMITTLDSK